jgi:cytidylate kinase
LAISSLRKIVIAIDGPAASGKSSTATRVAEILGYLHLDTGAMYRALTLKVLNYGIPLDDIPRIVELAPKSRISFEGDGASPNVFLDGDDVTEAIRKQEVSAAVSQVSSIAGVREVMVGLQRELSTGGGVVLDGRDIGTVVLPDADLKIFMVADVEERARRRRKDLEGAGLTVETEKVVEELTRRDRLDSTRAVSPLKKANDAIELDTTSMSFDQQVSFIVDYARALIEEGR